MLGSLSPEKSLSSKLVLVALGSVALPMLALTWIVNSIANDNLHEIARERIFAQATGSVGEIELYLFERQGDAQVMATLEQVRNLVASSTTSSGTSQASRLLTTIRDTYGYDAISVLDTSGEVLFSTSLQLRGENLSQRQEVMAALRGETRISEIGAGLNSDRPFFHIAAPIYNDQGDVIGVVDARANLDRLNEIVSKDEGSSGVGSYSVLLDRYLIPVVNPSDPVHLFVPTVPLSRAVEQDILATRRFGAQTERLLGEATNLTDIPEHTAKLAVSGEREISFDGTAGRTNEPAESIIVQLEAVDWYYLHRVPESSFNSKIEEQTVTALWVTFGAVLVSITLVLLFARYAINEPLSRLVKVAQALQAGDLSRRLNFQRSDEIGTLATSFNAMADGLEDRIRTEQTAQEEARRLQEIERSNREMLEQIVADYLAFLQRVAAGDLTQRLSVQHNGALGSLGQGLNTMVENLHGITSQVQQASANIAAAAAEILAATTQQASSAGEQSSAVSQTSTTVEEIKTIARQTAQQAGQVAHDSQEALQVAHQGTQSVEETVESMGHIRERVESIAQTILSLSEQTQAIGTIITTVSELADQSNLLALNAAIEAARAGEQGKSFAVVAQHVRDLAERSKGATGEVREILEEIQRSTNTAVLVTEEGTKGVESGTQLATEAGQMIHRIAAEVENGAQANVQMAAAAQQQMAGMEQIGQAIIAIQQATSQALTSTRQAERAAQDLHTLAQSLQQAVSTYRL